MAMNPYLASTEIIDWQTPEIYAEPLLVVVQTLRKHAIWDGCAGKFAG